MSVRLTALLDYIITLGVSDQLTFNLASVYILFIHCSSSKMGYVGQHLLLPPPQMIKSRSKNNIAIAFVLICINC